jgi:hypothetical protein
MYTYLVGKLKRSFGRGELDRVVRKDRRALWREPTLVSRCALQLVHGGSWFFFRQFFMPATTPNQVRYGLDLVNNRRQPQCCTLANAHGCMATRSKDELLLKEKNSRKIRRF